MTSKHKLRRLLRRISDGRFSIEKIGKMLTIFGEEQFLEARLEVEKFLNHIDCGLRYNALSTIVFEWGLKEHRKTCEEFLIKDPDDDNRALGASCLGSLLRNSNDLDALKLLLQVFNNKKEKWVVRDSAYFAILDIIGIPYLEQPLTSRKLNYEKDVNWKLIKSLKRKIKKGEIVKLKESGKSFNHIAKVQNAQQGLTNQIQKLQNALKNPKLSPSSRKAIENKLSEASELFDKSKKYVPPPKSPKKGGKK